MQKSKALEGLSQASRSHLQTLGENIRLAIRRRHLRRRDVAERALLSEPTLRAILRGDPKVSMGAYLAVLAILGLDDGIAAVADPKTDAVGIALAERRLPERVRVKVSKYDF